MVHTPLLHTLGVNVGSYVFFEVFVFGDLFLFIYVYIDDTLF